MLFYWQVQSSTSYINKRVIRVDAQIVVMLKEKIDSPQFVFGLAFFGFGLQIRERKVERATSNGH
jgi:hypothetical protein